MKLDGLNGDAKKSFHIMEPKGYYILEVHTMNLYLNYEGFGDQLIVRRELNGGIQYIFRFNNNYGASVVKHSGSYGYEADLWELAVLEFNGSGIWDWDLTYDTEITDDVLGWLNDMVVYEVLSKINALEASK